MRATTYFDLAFKPSRKKVINSFISSDVGDVKVKSSPLKVDIVKLRLPLLSIEL